MVTGKECEVGKGCLKDDSGDKKVKNNYKDN